MLPMVEPGKKPSLGAASSALGRRIGRVKSASIGWTGSPGKSRARSAAESRRKSPLMSIGT
jgi:hypothetical protein